ncbi:hypothetical protein B0T11DRAFT_104010 [Plectosphaerella cucumerina]|uniref:Uncharacterized protein n=1 Tax=Plectosphaerella cucumerina TaxID=40658 RepID=A0A8K0X356_9PEZI|nr:hypothetical protein B0T11DRAFT_104010 [Plectosphaerella cucumerina]
MYRRSELQELCWLGVVVSGQANGLRRWRYGMTESGGDDDDDDEAGEQNKGGRQYWWAGGGVVGVAVMLVLEEGEREGVRRMHTPHTFVRERDMCRPARQCQTGNGKRKGEAERGWMLSRRSRPAAAVVDLRCAAGQEVKGANQSQMGNDV